MKEVKNPEKLAEYLRVHKLEKIFDDRIVPHLSLFEFEHGESICSQGEVIPFLYLLVKGKLKVYTTSKEGKTLILTFLSPLEVIGDIEFVQKIEAINTVEAVSPVVMIGIRHQELQTYSANHAPFLTFLLEIVTKKFHNKSNTMRFNLMYPVEVRLASYLLSVSYDEKEAWVNGELNASTLTDTANLIGTSYRHLNRVIKQFCEMGLTERKKGFILIKDRKGLETVARQNIYEA